MLDYPDGRLAIRYQGPYATFDKLRQVPQANVVENKSLGAALAVIKTQQGRRNGEPAALPHAIPAPAVTADRLASALAFVREMQSKREWKRSGNAPTRRGQTNHMFKVG